MSRKRPASTEPSPVKRSIALVCFSHSLGGLELTTLRLAKAMKERGNVVTIVVPPLSPLHERAIENDLDVVALEPGWKYGDLTAALRLRSIMKDKRVEVVMLLQSKDLHLASVASLFVGNTKLVFYQQMDSGYNKRDPLHTWVFSRLARWICLTEGMKTNVLAHTRMAAEKVEVIPLGIDIENFASQGMARSSARAYFKLPRKSQIVGVIGRLDPQKGQEILLQAAPGLFKKHPSLHIVLAGDETAGEPGYRSHLEKLCDTLDIRHQVSFLPFTKEVAGLMAALDILVLPSYSETYGLVVIEAMAMNRPVVATNAGGVPEIISDGETGLLIPPRNAEALGNALHRILTNASLRSTIVRAAKQEVRRKFDFALTVDRLLSSSAAL